MRTRRAFTLLELIVTLAIIAAILTALVVSFIKRLDRIASEKEHAAMKSIGAAFKESVRRARYVPNESEWATMVAGQLGWQLSRVTVNERFGPRIFLIDPTMQIGTNSGSGPLLPYSQPVGGSRVTSGTNIVRPINPRFMVVSSIGKPLPSGLVSGLAATSGAASFTNLWSTPEGAVPSAWSGTYNWSKGADLKIERIDLSDLFLQITFANVDTNATHLARFGADESALATMATPSAGFATEFKGYYIRGSELKLVKDIESAGNVLEYSEVLYTNQEFTFELGSWQGKPFLGRTVAANGKVLQRAMDLFMKAPLNPYRKGGATQQGVHDAMTAYMTAFIAWRDAGYPGEQCPGPVGNNTYTAALATARANLSTVTGDLIDP